MQPCVIYLHVISLVAQVSYGTPNFEPFCAIVSAGQSSVDSEGVLEYNTGTLALCSLCSLCCRPSAACCLLSAAGAAAGALGSGLGSEALTAVISLELGLYPLVHRRVLVPAHTDAVVDIGGRMPPFRSGRTWPSGAEPSSLAGDGGGRRRRRRARAAAAAGGGGGGRRRRRRRRRRRTVLRQPEYFSRLLHAPGNRKAKALP